MTIVSSSPLPFQASYPAGYRPASGTGTSTSGAGAGAAKDVVDIRVPLPGGSFTVRADDSFSLRELFDIGGNTFDSVTRYRVALRDDPAAGGGGRLLLRGADVTAQVDFTPADFNELLFKAGPQGSRQDILVVARAGKQDGSGGLIGIVDSPPVQLTAGVTGSRSINAAAALRTSPGADDADFLAVVQDASLFSGLGKTRPALTTVGNFTAEANDSFSLRELFDAGSNAFESVARYRVALRDDPTAGGGGRLLLRGADVTAQVDFTPADFNELQFVAGPQGSSQDLVVVARAGRSDGQGGLLGIVDSPAVQVTAGVTGSRSINAAAALRTSPGADEADFLEVVQDASLFSGLGKTRPVLTTVGNFTAKANDSFSLRELFDAGSNAFDSVTRYRVALRDDPAAGGGGRLLLREADVTTQVDFTPADFNELQFVAGPQGSSQDLVVVARTGRSDGQGGLLGIVDSPAVQITAGVTGTRSINAAAALRTTAGPEDAVFLQVAQDASLFSGLGKTRPA